jgi:hypothetical protein
MKLNMNDKFIAGVAIFIVLLLVLSGLYYGFAYFGEEPETEKEEPVEEQSIDDRISPLTTQAVSLEINRIRKKGIEEQMRKIGTAWKKSPSYYFEAELHDGLWTSHDINEWDTDYVGWQAYRKVEEELDKCNIDVTIFENQKKLFGSENVEKDSFSIVYDFRTGRWTGDDTINDSDGMGYYNGDNFEIWFDVHQSDADGDGIPFWTEVNVLHTDPKVDDRYKDPDNDGISTAWEWKWNYNPMKYDNHTELDPDIDGLTNSDEYELRKYLANPYRPDIFVEVDFMEKKPGLFGYEHVFWDESQQMVMDEFSKQGISLHIDDGSMGEGGEYLDFHEEYIAQEGGIASEYYKYHFADDRKGVFRYGVIVHSAGWAHPQDYKLAYDVLSVPCNAKFYRSVFFPPAITPRMQRIAMGIGFMHELGHTLGLRGETNPGIDNASQIGRGFQDLPLHTRLQLKQEAIDAWENYESCMNYNKFGNFVLGYSDGSHGENDVDDWSMIDLTYFKRHEPDGVEGIEVDVD